MLITDRLTPHFTAWELAQHAGGIRTLPDAPTVCANLVRLAATLLEPFRVDWGAFVAASNLGGEPEVNVLCGWRSAALNAAIGGAGQSQHVLGCAADIYCDVDMEALREGRGTDRDADRMQTFAEFAEKWTDKGDVVGGIGIYHSVPSGQTYWVHMDIRPRVNGHVARWLGTHIGSEQ